jgi:asparagine synthase (glutamine-hydrolysing)
MCGIAGFVARKPLPPSHQSILAAMTGIQSHRGPDGFGHWHDEFAFLGHRRLAIVDLAGGHQPMSNEDGSLWITFNGEVFNHASLRPALEAAGHRYQSRSDTETLIHAFEQKGSASVEDFRGMFAYAIWDSNHRRLFAVRDRLGIKPFYYYFDGQVFVFASEIKALFQFPGIPCVPNTETFAEYLSYGYLAANKTMFAGIHSLAPGHWLELSHQNDCLQLRTECYWDSPVPSERLNLGLSEASTQVAVGLEQSVDLRLMSDVPLGLFLSGGVDSSAITALVRRLSKGQVKTFSVGYREQAFSELDYARQTAALLGTEHHEVQIGARDFFRMLPELVWHEDEPIAWPSSVSLFFVSQLARKHVTVVLTGEGADELFAGYQRYRHYVRALDQLRLYGRLPAALRDSIRSLIETFPGLGPDLRRKLGHTILGRSASLESLYLENYYAAFSAREIDQLLPGRTNSPHASFLQLFETHPSASLLARLLYADQKSYLSELLRKQDRMSMATSIESRVPFLDHHFLSFVSSLPDEFKLAPNGQNKFILKQAVQSFVPAAVIRRKKMGFPTPLSDWLRGEFRTPVHKLLTEKDSFLQSVLSPQAVRAVLQSSDSQDTTDRIWRLLNLEIWGRRFFLNRPVSFEN